MKEEKETFMSVMHSFVADPLLEHIKGNEQYRGETITKVLNTVEMKLDGCLDAEGVPLSVKGQVDCLIKKATDFDNLASMFFGWMPSL